MKLFIRSFSSVSLVVFVTLCSCFCAGRAAGQVLVWGNPNLTNVPPSATNVIALAAGDLHGLALRADGTVVAWGNNGSGQTNVPTDLTNAVSVAAGSWHSLALRKDGTVVMWGHFYGTSDNTVSPQATNVVALALGPGAHHALVLRADGTVVDWYWGLYYYDIPPTARNIVSVAAGPAHSVALRSDGLVVAWGDNSYGELNVPAAATNIVAIAVGWYGNAALRADGTILTWGRVYSAPQSQGFTNVIDVACPFNSNFTGNILALRSDGTVVESPGSGSVSPPANATNVAAVAAGSYDALALIGSGPPVFPGFPVNRTVAAGATAYLRLMAVGAFPLSYQWSCNGTNIPDATNTVLVLTNVQPGQSGTCYTLMATNISGMATSAPIKLLTPPFVFNTGSTNLLMTTNGLRLQLDGVFATNSVIIYASTNLVGWLPILTNSPATGSVLFLDSSATNWLRRYYRATEQ
jgi:alpha-tubulin suppressor-like RCC1 family protein